MFSCVGFGVYEIPNYDVLLELLNIDVLYFEVLDFEELDFCKVSL